MPKKKNISSSWLKREIDKKLYYPFIFFIFLLFVFVAIAYSIPSIGIPIEDNIQTYFNNLFSTLTNPSPPSSSKYHMTVETIKIPAFIYDLLGHRIMPSATPQPILHRKYPPGTTQIEQLPNIKFDLLRISHTGYTSGVTATNVNQTTNLTTINEIYDDIKKLPIMLPGTYNCPAEFANTLQYSLNFYSNGTLTISVLVHTSGCREVEISPHYTTRMVVGPEGEKLLDDLRKI